MLSEYQLEIIEKNEFSLGKNITLFLIYTIKFKTLFRARIKI